MGQSTETVRVQFVADTASAIADAARLGTQLEATKKQLTELAKQTTASFDHIAKSLKKQRQAELMSEFKVKSDPNPITGKVTVDREALAKAKAAYNEYADSVREALREIAKDEKTSAAQRAAINKSLAKEQEQTAKKRVSVATGASQKIVSEEQKAASAQIKAQETVSKAREAQAAKAKKFLDDVSALASKYAGPRRTDPLINADITHAHIEKIKQDILALKATSERSFDEIAQGMRDAFAAQAVNKIQSPVDAKNAKASIVQFNKDVTTALRQVDKEFKASEKAAKGLDNELKQKPKDAKGVTSAFQKMGDVSKYVFGTLLGVSAIQVLRDIGRWFSDAVKSGEEFAQSIFKLSASVRALQRTGFNITMQDTVEMLDKLGKRYTLFSQKELVDGVAQVQLLTRSFGFNKKQMEDTFEVAGTLSAILGKDFNEAARETALFLSSGYAESMQKAGLAVNRKTVQDEAHRLGIEKSYMAMSEQERSMAALSLLYREIGPLMDEVQAYQESEIGQLKLASTQYENVKNMIGLKLVPAKLEFVKALVRAYHGLSSLNGLMIIFRDSIYVNLITPILLATNVWKEFTSGSNSFGDALAKTAEQAALIKRTMVEMDLKKAGVGGMGYEDMLKGADLPEHLRGTMPLLSAEESDEQLDMINKTTKAASKMIRDYHRDVAEAGRDLSMDMGQIDANDLDAILGQWDNFFSRQENLTVDATEAQQDQWERFFGEFGSIVNDGLDEAFDIWQNYYDKLDDIARKEQQNIIDENADYANAITDANRDAQQDAADAARKYRDEELKAEREFQEKMRRLKEQYLFDLEDALRERDALQVLRLMRKYQMDKRNAEIDYELDAQSRKEAYQRELEDIRIQRERKLQELAIEHQRRLEDIRIQAEREREEAARNRDQAMEQLKADLEQERKERQIKYEQELEDLKTRFGERLAEIMIGLADEEGMTKEKLDAIGQLYLGMFGKQGIVGMSYDQLAQMTQNAVIEAQNALAQIEAMALQASQTAADIAAQTAQAQLNLSSLSMMQQANMSGYQPYTTTASPQNTAPKGPYGHAFGGTDYANTPTLALFGEAGPEIATFTPVSRFNTKNLGVPNANLGDTLPGMSGEGKTSVLIRLSPGLMAEIVDGAMTGVARIIEEQ